MKTIENQNYETPRVWVSHCRLEQHFLFSGGNGTTEDLSDGEWNGDDLWD